MEEKVTNLNDEKIKKKLEDTDIKDLKVGYHGDLEDIGTLAQKMSRVAGNVGIVEKTGKNKYHNYDYAQEKDILDAIRPLLKDEGVHVFQSVDDYERIKDGNGVTTIVSILYAFIEGESGAMFVCRYYGEGQDKQDKSFYKAYTGANKYAVMKNFLVSTGDDPEKDNRSKKKSGPTSKQLRSKIKSFYKQNKDDVEGIIFDVLEDKGKDKDISLLSELNKKSLINIYKKAKKAV